MLRVSVIIPVYNGASFITEAIDSVLNQSLPTHEIIVINDGSTDTTATVIAPYEAQGKVRVLTFSEKKGVAAARNAGVAHATGEIIGFLDADDRWTPRKLEKQLPLFDDAAVGLVYSDMLLFGAEHGRYKDRYGCTYRRGAVLPELLRENFIPTSTVLVRRSSITATRGFIENKERIPIGEDYYAWLTLALSTRFDFVDEPLTEYRVHAAQSSKSRSKNYASVKHLFQELIKNPAFAPYAPILRSRIIRYTLKQILYALTCR